MKQTPTAGQILFGAALLFLGFWESGCHRKAAPAKLEVARASSVSLSSVQDEGLPIQFSVTRGFYQTPFKLELRSRVPGVTICYTVNGSEPNPGSGAVYKRPLVIDRTSTVRAALVSGGELASPVQTHSYLFIDPKFLAGLPAVSLVTASNHLFGPTGIMETEPRNTVNRGRAWERPVSVEWIRPEDNGGFQINAGLNVRGGEYIRALYDYRSKELPYKKYSFQLTFRKEYGASKLHYPVFPDEPVAQFHDLVLRAGVNDPNNPFIRDQLLRDLSAQTSHAASHGTFAHLYLNGVYQGLYNPSEHLCSDSLRAWHGGGKHWDVIREFAYVKEGDDHAWQNLFRIVDEGPAHPAVYRALGGLLDIEQFIDYLLPHLYAGSDDWPANNWCAARERSNGAKFRFYTWDAEWSFGYSPSCGRQLQHSVSFDSIQEQLCPTNYDGAWIGRLFDGLMTSPEFRLKFADHVHKHFFNEGVLTDDCIKDSYERRKREIEPLFDGQFDDTIGRDWIPQRRRFLLEQFARAGLLASSNAPALFWDPKAWEDAPELSMATSSGQIWFTTNGLDPRVPFTGEIHPYAQPYIKAIRISSPALVKARTLFKGTWSALTEAEF